LSFYCNLGRRAEGEQKVSDARDARRSQKALLKASARWVASAPWTSDHRLKIILQDGTEIRDLL